MSQVSVGLRDHKLMAPAIAALPPVVPCGPRATSTRSMSKVLSVE